MASRDNYCDLNLNGGKLLKAGFEEVSSLPTTNLFAGREVFYDGQKYVYNGGVWTSQLDPQQKFNTNLGASINSDIESLNNRSKEVILGNAEISQIPTLLSGGVNSSLLEDIITYSDALIEKQGANSEVWSPLNFPQITLTQGQKLRITAWRHDIKGLAKMSPGQIQSIYVPHNWRGNYEKVTIEYLTWTNATGDNNIENANNYTWWKIYEKELKTSSYWILPLQRTLYYNPHEGGAYGNYYILNVRITIELTRVIQTSFPTSIIKGCYIYTSRTIKTKTTPVYINYDAVIEPTQSTKSYKTIAWILQYLTQGVNWLRDNHLPLSGGALSGDIKAPQFIVPNGTASQFLKADGSLDSNAYALHADLNNVKNNAWKLSEANAEVSTVVIALQGDMSVFAAMNKAGINYQTSRNIYVDMSEADSTITDIFAGYENLPVGIRYHIFFGNTKHDCKINWNESKVESNLVPSLGLTLAYPTAKCEFMRVTEEWTYADWEAKIENVSHVIDTGTASESDNSTLMNYMDNNKVSYTKTAKGALVNITALLAALAGNGK